MKIKTSITLSEDLLQAVDQRVAEFKNRSDLIEVAVRSYLARRSHEEEEARDLSILNRTADRLNREAAEVLDYQVIP
ncbi:MAG: ribbon-helix-helix protein, CopG family [Acidobacteria bacterium]|nr:ribbon-helix-helix protein, CopG family [Acidobacteriota bacterium]